MKLFKSILGKVLVFFLIASIFYFNFVFVADKRWEIVPASAENYLYVRASAYVTSLYKKIADIKNIQDAFHWATAFTFHLAPFALGEKPLFIMLLGYSYLLHPHPLLFKGLMIDTASILNMLLMVISAYLIYSIFHDLKKRILGILAANLFLLNIGLNLSSQKGEPLVFGLFLFLLVFRFYHKWQCLTPPRLFLLGFLISLVIFSAHNTITLSVSFIVFMLLRIVSEGKGKGLILKNVSYFTAGISLLFTYFSLRDIVVSAGFLNRYRDFAIAKHVAIECGRGEWCVFSGFHWSIKEALSQRLPRGDFLFFFDYLKSYEGLFLMVFAFALILLPLLLKRVRVQGLFRADAVVSGEGERLKQCYLFFLFNALVSFLIIVLLPLPYIARAYVPVTILFILCACFGLLLIKDLLFSKNLYLVIAVFAVLVQTIHYKNTAHFIRRDSVSTDSTFRLDAVIFETEDEAFKALESLYRQGVTSVCLPPLITSYSIMEQKIINYPAYLLMESLLKKGLPYSKHRSMDSFVKFNLYDSEHIYYQLKRKRTNGVFLGDLVPLTVRMARVFEPDSFYFFDLKDLLRYAKAGR
ncbi:MAG: hypothetical protein PHR11_02890 [Candidatus Omnitrophica bacterium]|nr:hypothetical protein [Candidatus Omnitrophota bacterium]